MLVAPTEPAVLQALGTTSSTPERFGADFFWVSKRLGGPVGVQRKEVKDLINSLHDGRLGAEINLLAERVKLGLLVIEGPLRWRLDGSLASEYARWTRVSHRGLLRTVQAKGVMVEHSDDLVDTAGVILGFRHWVEKDHHLSLDRRPTPKGKWGGLPAKTDLGVHLLQAIPMMGPTRAEQLIAHFGEIPLRWSVTERELLEVKGLGPMRVAAMLDVLPAQPEREVEVEG